MPLPSNQLPGFSNPFSSGDVSLISNNGSNAQYTLSNTGVIAGTYSASTVTVDSKGRITAASSGTGGERVATPTITSGTLTIDCANGTVFNVALNNNITTFTTINAPSGAFAFTLHFTADGTGRTVTWGSNVKWAGGAAPTLTSTSTKIDTLTFETSNAGVPWLGYVSGQNF